MPSAPCPHCGHPESYVSGTNRRRCRNEACRKTFHSTVKGDRNRAEVLPPEKCPRCGVVGSPKKHGITGGKRYVACEPCGKCWVHGAHLVPVDAADHDMLVVTCAVNDTPVHGPFMRALLRYCAERGARLIVIPLRYKNPTSQRENDQPVTWAKQVLPYLVDQRLQVCKGLQILADIKTQPTSSNPLTGKDGLTGTDSCIVGHPRIALESVATRGHELPKLMLTTGAVTRPNYSRTDAGARGEFNHVMGAVVVEVDRANRLFHLRHINATSAGSFIDLDREYLPDEPSRQAQPALALVLGDGHAELADPDAVAAAREQQALLRPRRLVWHDVHNHGSASHHSGFWERFARRVTGRDKVFDELMTTAALVDSFHVAGQETVVVSSNHHEHLGRWLADHRNADDVQNAALYHRAKAEVLAEIQRSGGKIPDIFALVMRPLLKHPVRFLTERDSLSVAGIELAYHGDKGPNGSRGSAKALNKIGVKSIIGHSHSPRIVGGCYQTGTLSLLDMGYNTGPSSWLHSNVVVYANGKRSHLHVIRGRFRKEDSNGSREAARPNAARPRRQAPRAARGSGGRQVERPVRGGGVRQRKRG